MLDIKVIKRNGDVEEYQFERIVNAIASSGNATREFGYDTAVELAKTVEANIRKIVSGNGGIIDVEMIQDLVEITLMESPFKKTAKAYILYRDQHSKVREMVTKAKLSLVEQYLESLDWRVKENSNMSYSLQGLNHYLSSEIVKSYWLNSIYSPEVKRAYVDGDFHIHDLGTLSAYCVGWDLQDLLMTGFGGVEGKITSAPPKHFSSALGQIVNFFYTLQGESAGAQAFSNFDTLLAPYVRKDGLSYEEVKQCVQEFIYNMNVPTRVGFQTPFTNLTFDLRVSPAYADMPVVIGGEVLDSVTYADFQKEMDMINKAFLEVMLAGDACGRVFTFPIPTYNITKDFCWDSEIAQLLWQVTAKYGIPYFSNFVNSDLKPEDVRSMCCRLRLNTRELKRRGGFFASNPLTGSIGVVTINLPRIGYLSKSKKEFESRLSDLMELAKVSLEEKRKAVERFTDAGLYPYSKFYLRNIKERFGKFWINHFSTIGIVGMNEALLNFMGVGIDDDAGIDFAVEIMHFMREKLVQFQKQTGNMYNLEATPAESASYRLAKLDKSRYPDILVANEEGYRNGAEPFYTNSTHLPVNYTGDVFEVLEKQDKLQSLYTGGTVLHIFVGEQIKDASTVGKLVKLICENFTLPYFTITPTFSICPKDGYLSGECPKCYKCGGVAEVYSRVVGYLRPVSQWNAGKVEEFKMRKKLSL